MRPALQAGWRILVPPYGTSEAQRALAYASPLARASGGGITPGSAVVALDADLVSVDRIKVDRTDQIEAFWVRADGILATDMRISAEWVERDDREHQLRVRASRADIETYLRYESRRGLMRG